MCYANTNGVTKVGVGIPVEMCYANMNRVTKVGAGFTSGNVRHKYEQSYESRCWIYQWKCATQIWTELRKSVQDLPLEMCYTNTYNITKVGGDLSVEMCCTNMNSYVNLWRHTTRNCATQIRITLWKTGVVQPLEMCYTNTNKSARLNGNLQ